MPDTIHEIEQFVAGMVIGMGLLAASAAFLLAGFIQRHRQGHRLRTRSILALRDELNADLKLAGRAQEEDIKAAYDAACQLDDLCHACSEHPSQDGSLICSLCRGLGIEQCKRCNDWSLLDSNDECPECAIATEGRPAGRFSFDLVFGNFSHDLDPRTCVCKRCGNGPFTDREVPKTCVNPDTPATWCRFCRGNNHSYHLDSGGRCMKDSQYNADCTCPVRPISIPTVFGDLKFLSEERCLVTGNPCGTDTWAEGYICSCANCQKLFGPATLTAPGTQFASRRLSPDERVFLEAAKSQSRCPECGGTKRCQNGNCWVGTEAHPCHACNGLGVRCICKAKPHPSNRYCPIHGGEDRNP